MSVTERRQCRPLKSTAPTTVKTLLDVVHARLQRAGVVFGHGSNNAWDEAAYLVLYTLRLPQADLSAVLARKTTAPQRDRALRLIDERIRRRVPAAYLTHEAWLGDFRFYVDERVIVPRSFIAELLRERFSPWLLRPMRIKRALDLCTGSGCLAILLAKTFATANIDATDISRDALAVARKNVTAYRLGRRIHLVKADMFSALHGNTYDLIVANPPYVSTGRMRNLPPEYRHEPRLALSGGKDGFDAVRIILQQAAAHLSATGLLVVEVGHNRRRLERSFPHLPFVWPHTSAGSDCVFMLHRRDLCGPVVTPHRETPARPESDPG